MLIHGLQIFYRKNVTAIISTHFDEQWTSFIGEVLVDSIVGFIRFRIRCKIAKVGVEIRRGDGQMSHEANRDHTCHNEDEEGRALEQSSTIGHLSLKCGSIHADCQRKALQKEGGVFALAQPPLIKIERLRGPEWPKKRGQGAENGVDFLGEGSKQVGQWAEWSSCL